MKVSQGVLFGREVYLYHPEYFNEHDEVIIFTREEFRRMYQSMSAQMEQINRTYLTMDPGEEWRVMGVWFKIMESIHRLNLNLDDIFSNKPLQSYLDAYIQDTIDSPPMVFPSSLNEMVTPESLGVNWSRGQVEY
ncbi:hypothetical protein [Methanobacterium sp. BAmetb5]|uniref:hypothetical protein n=1 Tax=Methanobacterium sp. BAmetb5 TaxID=2025351 RepID=UPI000E87E6AD|nr:hypothetical protein [Methanobacterium sp. BAmetb5]AXV39479.1 MAG: hypothetical protein CIT02_03700 [Methanobacterium sp. BAmetb5]